MEEKKENKIDIGTIVGLIGIFMVLMISVSILGLIKWDYSWMLMPGLLGIFLLLLSIISIPMVILSFINVIEIDIEEIIFFIIGFICIGVCVINISNTINSDSTSAAMLLNISYIGIVIGIIPIIGGFLKIESR